MKKISLILLTTLFTLVFTSTYAQEFIDWHWDDHGLKFSAPSDMIVEVNNGDQFGARLKNDLLHLYVFPWQDKDLSKETLGAEVKKLMKSLGYRGTQLVELELNGFEGSYILADKDGVTCILEGLLDPDSATNFYALIIYGPGYDDEALEIANSFTK
jgi:hypothetical protein